LKILDDLHRALDLRVGQFGINWQAQDFVRGLFGDWKVANLVAEICIAFLQVQRHWVMQRATDAIGFEMFFEVVRRG